MSISCLHNAAESYVSVMHLQPLEENQVRSTVYNHSVETGQCCCGYIIYRIIQAFKSLLCASDWQVTKKMMSARWIDVLIKKNLIPQDQQKEYANYFYSSLAEVLLNKMVDAQENRCRPASERIKDWDVITVAEKRAKGYTVQ